MENKKINLGIKTRTIIVLLEFLRRILVLLHSACKLVYQLILSLFMMFSQNYFDYYIDYVRKDIEDETCDNDPEYKKAKDFYDKFK